VTGAQLSHVSCTGAVAVAVGIANDAGKQEEDVAVWASVQVDSSIKIVVQIASESEQEATGIIEAVAPAISAPGLGDMLLEPGSPTTAAVSAPSNASAPRTVQLAAEGAGQEKTIQDEDASEDDFPVVGVAIGDTLAILVFAAAVTYCFCCCGVAAAARKSRKEEDESGEAGLNKERAAGVGAIEV